MDCLIFRCNKQEKMYLYTRAAFKTEWLTETLLKRIGYLTPVLALFLTAECKL